MNGSVSVRTLRALAVFGLSVPQAAGAFAEHEQRAARAAAAGVLRAVRGEAGARVLLAGPSGAGKTTAMRLAARALRRRGVRCIQVDAERLRNERGTAVELIPGGLEPALRTLARAGLSDATLLALPSHRLSEGQRWRLALAVAQSRAARARGGSRCVLLADELCAGLDLATARGVAMSAGRGRGVAIVAATSRDELIQAIGRMPEWTVIRVGV
jgi:ABC-type ATPase with predicted acetyltransferase domain